MTSLASTVGPLDLPIPAGAANSPITDPLITGLLAYIGHWLKIGLDAKLAVLGGPDTTAVTDACPTANRFDFDPKGWWTRAVIASQQPCLFIWHKSAKRFPQSTVYDMRERQIGVLYVFPEFNAPRGFPTRTGLMNAVDAIIRRAFDRGAHPTYENGVQFTDTIADVDTLEVYLDGTEEGFEFASPQTGAGAGGQPDGGFEQYGFPTLRGTIIARERIGADTFEDPDDILGDITFTITHNEQGDVANGLDVLEGVFPAPDGSEDGDEVV